MKKCCHNSFDILSSYLRPDCIHFRYLRYIYLKAEKTVNDIFVPSTAGVLCRSHVNLNEVESSGNISSIQ